MTSTPPTIPGWFTPGHDLAGAVDHIDPIDGFRGWVVDRRQPRRALLVEARAAGESLLQGLAGLSRPDLVAALQQPLRAAFALEWRSFDRAQVARLAAVDPGAVVGVVLEDGAALPFIGPAPTLAQLLALIEAPRPPQHAGFATLRLALALRRLQLVDPDTAGDDPIFDYLEGGEAAGRWPNRYFDPALVAAALGLAGPEGALAAYLQRPEAVARTSLYFDQDWWLTQAPPGTAIPLAAHLADPKARDPNPHLSRARLEQEYPEAKTAADPYAAALRIAESRGEAARWQRLLAEAAPSPVPQLLTSEGFAARRALAAAALPAPGQGRDLFARLAARRAVPDDAEAFAGPTSATPRAKTFALLLPPAGGDPLAEATLLASALPRLADQAQPRLPAPRLDLAAQAALALQAGLAGFCLPWPLPPGMEVPQAPGLAWLTLWSDGRDPWLAGRIPETDPFPDHLASFLADPRCLRLDGRPVLLVARDGLAPQGMPALRQALATVLGAEPLLFLAQGKASEDPRALGYDGTVEIPPPLGGQLGLPAAPPAQRLDAAAALPQAPYEAALAAALRQSAPDWPWLRCAIPDFDEEPRQPGAGRLLRGAMPAAFADWLRSLADRAEAAGQLLLVDSWNGFADGTALLPERALGHARLNALSRALHPVPSRLRAGLPGVSVVVPSFQSAAWLADRLGSIFAQTLAPAEILLLDDASTDDSVAVAERIAAAAGRALRVVRCPQNSGNVSRQWQRAAGLASQELLWIAEADDLADPRFLEVLATKLADDPQAAMAFCDSGAVDPGGRLLAPDRKPYAAALGDAGLLRDGAFDGPDFAGRFLAPRNLVLTASAVLWRRDALRAAFAAAGEEAFAFTCAGDWRLYLAACQGGGRVQYVAAPLARQRQHPDSVTASLAKDRHLEEIARLHALIAASAPVLEPAMAGYRDDLRRHWSLA
ncbi:glycoside hydrolase family 99-like domain-containing protein [Roseomonas sp. 18066]|uniref:glycoside hydrolase family 99-like domain-containing protein n=1 Tax=Roseomonas sp. 18066 TaxID=2681412 RepID=UPI00135AED3A|nr:glycoside hydrolase family 99-like domain-containing protein [Roseomonas sp. 18066]